MLCLEVFQVRPLRLVEVLPSLNVPVAVNLIDVPFAILNAAGAGAFEPVLNFNRGSFALPSTQTSGSTTKGSVGDIYFEPVNLLSFA